eukprot:9933574-Alexandrium_andersonii.AAC.1
MTTRSRPSSSSTLCMKAVARTNLSALQVAGTQKFIILAPTSAKRPPETPRTARNWRGGPSGTRG